MTIEKIDPEICSGCGECVDNCPMDCIRMDEQNGLAVIRYPQECMLCLFCERNCPTGAIYVSPEKHTNVIVAWG